MNVRTSRGRIVVGLVAALVVAGSITIATGPAVADDAVAATPSEQIPPRPRGEDPWLETINWWRSLGGGVDGSPFPRVTNAAGDNTSSQNHVDYLASIWSRGSSYCGHGEDSRFPKQAGVDYWHNVLFCGPATLTAAVDGWNNTPYHGGPLLNPRVVRVGAGRATTNGRYANAARAYYGSSPAATTYTFPADGGVLPRAAMTIGESPDPKSFCPPVATASGSGTPGQAVFAWLPDDAEFVSASLRDGAGPIPFCVLGSPFSAATAIIDPGERATEFIVFARRPYTVGSTVTAEIVTTDGAGGVDSTKWSFDVVDLPERWFADAAGRGGHIRITPRPVTAASSGGLPVTRTVSIRRVEPPSTSEIVRSVGDVAFSVPVPPGRYEVTLEVANAVGSPGSSVVTVEVGENFAPQTPTLSSTRLAANTPAGVQVGEVRSWDPNWDEVTLSLSGADAASFRLDGNVLITAAGFDSARLRPYQLTIRATDPLGLFSEATVVISVGVTPSGGSTPPPNDNRRDAIRLDGESGEVTFDSTNATAEPGEPDHHGIPATHSVWYRFNHPRAARLTVSTSVGFDTVLAVYRWNGRLIPVASNDDVADDFTSSVSVNIDPGVDYFVAVDGFYGAFGVAALVYSLEAFADPVPGAGLVPVVPARLLDTRPGQPTIDNTSAGIGRRDAGTTTTLTVTGRDTIPTTAAAVIVNIAAIRPTRPGHITVWPCGTPRPTASTLNVIPGATIANSVLTNVGNNGTICIYTSTPTDLITDITGYLDAP